MARKEYTIRGAHVGGGAGVQDLGMLALEMHLIECSNETILVPHGSLLGDVERRKCRRGLRRCEGRVSQRRRGKAPLGASRPAEPKEGPVAPMDCSKARGPWGKYDLIG